MGVTLFFIVSAFSLCLTMPNHIKKPAPLFSFYCHRFFRIAPLFYFWIILSIFRDETVFGVSHDITKVLGQVLFAFNLIPGEQEGFVWASWTIGVEMVFYILFPLCFHFLNSLSKVSGFFFLSLAAYPVFRFGLGKLGLNDANFLYHSIFRHLCIFICGMGVFYFYRLLEEREKRRSISFLCLCLSFFLYSSLLLGKLEGVIFSEDYFWQGIVFGSLFLGVAFFPCELIVNGPTKFFGKISYSLYLAHPTFIFILTPLYHRIMALEVLLSFKYFICVGVTFAVLILVSFITFVLIEKPGIRWGRRIEGKIQNQIREQSLAV